MRNSLVSNTTVSYVNEIIETGINERASDIHISFDETDGMEIKYRIDGILRESEKLYVKIDRKILSKKWADTGTVKVMKSLQKTIRNFQINSHSF